MVEVGEFGSIDAGQNWRHGLSMFEGRWEFGCVVDLLFFALVRIVYPFCLSCSLLLDDF